MNREEIRKVIGDAVGNPESGNVHDALDVIASAVAAALNTASKIEKRVIEPRETREA